MGGKFAQISIVMLYFEVFQGDLNCLKNVPHFSLVHDQRPFPGKSCESTWRRFRVILGRNLRSSRRRSERKSSSGRECARQSTTTTPSISSDVTAPTKENPTRCAGGSKYIFKTRMCRFSFGDPLVPPPSSSSFSCCFPPKFFSKTFTFPTNASLSLRKHKYLLI